MTDGPAFRITRGYVPSAIGRIAELHGVYYHNHWNFDLYFEAKVATELSAFLMRYDEQRDGLWVATVDGQVEGSIVIDGIDAHSEVAHLRWFIVSDSLRGHGVGQRLFDCALNHCREQGFRQVYLWTFEGLDAARKIYESGGFYLAEQRKGQQWGYAVNEQYFVLDLA